MKRLYHCKDNLIHSLYTSVYVVYQVAMSEAGKIEVEEEFVDEHKVEPHLACFACSGCGKPWYSKGALGRAIKKGEVEVREETDDDNP